MKFIVSLISSLLVGLSLGASNFSPIMEVQRLLANRRKVLYSIVLATTAFVFVLSCIILASIESALQFQNQGFVAWSPLLTVAGAFFAVGLICLLAARQIFPLKKSAESQPQQFGQTQTAQILEFLMKNFIGDEAAPQARPPAPPAAPAYPEPERRAAPQAPVAGPSIPPLAARTGETIQH